MLSSRKSAAGAAGSPVRVFARPRRPPRLPRRRGRRPDPKTLPVVVNVDCVDVLLVDETEDSRESALNDGVIPPRAALSALWCSCDVALISAAVGSLARTSVRRRSCCFQWRWRLVLLFLLPDRCWSLRTMRAAAAGPRWRARDAATTRLSARSSESGEEPCAAPKSDAVELESRRSAVSGAKGGVAATPHPHTIGGASNPACAEPRALPTSRQCGMSGTHPSGCQPYPAGGGPTVAPWRCTG